MITHDRLGPKRRVFEKKLRTQAFAGTRRTETFYAVQLRKVARHVGELVRSFPPGDPQSVGPIRRVLQRYAESLVPWATATGQAMLRDVSHRDVRAWMEASRDMARSLRAEIAMAPTGQLLRDFLADQVHLITSLPTEAAERVHRLTLEGIVNATRAKQISEEIMRTGEVTKSRANLIARTEVARTASGLTQARATYVGSEGYIWRTAEDSDVRPSHRKMNGKFVRWDDPPTLDNMVGHAGQYPNCRCYPEPVIPDDI